MRFARLRLAISLFVCGLAVGDAAEVQETGAEGVFYGRGLVKRSSPERAGSRSLIGTSWAACRRWR
jgi:pyridoxal biosynthesis lyase PdxS